MDKYDMQAHNKGLKSPLYKLYRTNATYSLAKIFAQMPAAGWMT